MESSLWLNGHGEWAVCDGAGPLNVVGYIQELPGGRGWAIKDDVTSRVFLDRESAASSILGRPLPEDVRYYVLRQGSETRTVLTYPEVIESLLSTGEWIKVASAKTLAELTH